MVILALLLAGFAPTNKAFEGVGVAAFFKDTDALKPFLLNRVLGSVVMLTDFLDDQEVAILGEGKFTVKIDDRIVMVNNVKVTGADVKAINSAMHAVDSVIIFYTKIVNDKQEK